MKKLCFVFCCVCSVWFLMESCATSEERAAQAAEKAQQVSAALAQRHFKIGIDRMYPMRGTPRSVSFGFSVEVKGDTLVSYLPYFGRAYHVPYGGGKGLNFSERISSYNEWQLKKGQRHIEIGLANDEDTYLYTIEVFTNGSATSDVLARERERISYSGVME